MKTKIITFYIASLLVFSGCSDFLDLTPRSSRNTLNFYNTAEDFDAALIGSYSMLRAVYNTNEMAYMTEISTDNTIITSPRSGGNAYSFEFVDLAYTSLNRVFYSEWSSHYIGIGRVNAIIDRIEGVEMPDEQKSQYLGEAQFLRALLYFNLVRWFGKVPLIINEVANPDDVNDITRNDEQVVYQQIIVDLEAASGNLPITLSTSELGRATKGAAVALLGKVYLTLREYDKAIEKLAEIMDKSMYPSYRLLPEYADVFSWSTPTNDEIIFNIQFQSGNTGQGSNYGRAMAAHGTAETVLGPQGGRGQGVNIPTQDLIDAYETNDKRKEFSIREYYMDGNGVKHNDPYCNKFLQFNSLPDDSDVDFPILRYADVILMYAECLNEVDRTSEALPYLNQIRERAGLDPENDLSQDSLRLAIERERRVEFAFEFHRWFDLARTNRYLTVMGDKGYSIPDYYKLYLIPQLELDINPSLGQNDGY